MPRTRDGLELDDVGMLGLDKDKAEKNWPAFPVLPVKRYKSTREMPDCGVVLHASVAPKAWACSVVKANIFDIGKATALKDADKVNYDSFEDMVKDGWVVD
jgi:hypothetical protein